MGKQSSVKHIEEMLRKYVKGKERLRDYGYHVITGYNEDGLGSVLRCFYEDRSSADQVISLTKEDLDVTKPETFRILDKYKDLASLTNCAAIMDLKWFEDYTPQEVNQIVQANLIGAYNLTSYFVKKTLNLEWTKNIVHIGSMAARVPLNGSAPYCISKAGLEMMVRCAAWELAPKNYNVFAIHPSNIRGSVMENETINKIIKFRKISRKEARDYWNAGQIRGSMLRYDDVANLSCLCVMGYMNHLSGSALCLNGGNR